MPQLLLNLIHFGMAYSELSFCAPESIFHSYHIYRYSFRFHAANLPESLFLYLFS